MVDKLRRGQDFVKFLNRRVQSALDRSHGNRKRFGGLAILQTLIIDEHNHPAKRFRQSIHRLADIVGPLRPTESDPWARPLRYSADSSKGRRLPRFAHRCPHGGRDLPYDGGDSSAGHRSPGSWRSCTARGGPCGPIRIDRTSGAPGEMWSERRPRPFGRHPGSSADNCTIPPRIGGPTPQTPAGPLPRDRRGGCLRPFVRRDRSRGRHAVASCRSCCSSVVRTYSEKGSREGARTIPLAVEIGIHATNPKRGNDLAPSLTLWVRINLDRERNNSSHSVGHGCDAERRPS